MSSAQGFVTEDTIFITGLPEDTTEDQLSEYFGQIGRIKYDKKNDCQKIWIYKDKATGKGKGEATITYEDPPTATSAIKWFNGKEFNGNTLTIELAQRKSAPYQFGRGGGRGGGRMGPGRGGFSSGGGGYDRSADRPGNRDDARGGGGRSGGRPGDWLCPSCSNNNFAYRQECNRCRTQKPAGAGGDSGNGSHFNDGSGGCRHYDDRGSRGMGHGSRGARSDSRNFVHRNDNRDRDRDRDDRGDRDRGEKDRERDRSRDGNKDRNRDCHRDRDRDRSRADNYGSGGSGPSRNHPRDDRRSRPY